MEIVRDEISSRKLKLSVELNASDHMIMADESRLQQVFWNLLKNASKFTRDEGGITVRTFNPQPRTLQIEEGRCRSCGEDFDPQRFAVDSKVQAAAADGDEDQGQ